MQVRIALLDDHQLFRDGLSAVLFGHPDLTVVAEASTGRALLDQLSDAKPTLVVLDVSLPGMNGFAVSREIRRRDPRCMVMMLSMHGSDENVTEALGAGARGYALKDQLAPDILGAIRAVARGEYYLAPKIPEALLQRHLRKDDRQRDPRSPLDELSTREREVFNLVVRGFTNDALSRELIISVKTVETHRARINKKLGVHSTADLVRFAARRGLLSDNPEI
ncbi:MAG: response regulator transcription factor [Polyangiaceae bacterium]